MTSDQTDGVIDALRRASRASQAAPDAAARLERLARPDKWYLADGRGSLWAPPFPVWLAKPGFWDEATIHQATLAPLFTVALIDGRGRETALEQTERRWRPDQLVCRYRTPEGATLVETRRLRPTGRYESSWSWAGLSSDHHLVAFTVQKAAAVHGLKRDGETGLLSWRQNLPARGSDPMPARMAFAADAQDQRPTAAVQCCQGTAMQPHWRLAPFGEMWRPGRGLVPRGEAWDVDADDPGLCYLAIDVGLATGSSSDESGVTFALNAVPEQLTEGPTSGDDAHWREHFDAYPRFEASDPYLDRYFDYRVYGLHLCEMRGPAGHLQHPAVAEGIAYFHVPITYSGQCHMLETAWAHDPAVARGTLANFIDNQKDDGSFHGRIYTTALERTDFYHANWGDALLAVDAVHPDGDYLRRMYAGLVRYHDWLTRSRDAEGSGMIDVINHFETGQEYMSRYQVVNPTADRDGWAHKTRLKGIDTTVYAYQLSRALQKVARKLGDTEAAERFGDRAEVIGHAILNRMWDEEAGMFSDVRPDTMERTGVHAAVCFYPMLTDLLDETHVARMLAHLRDEAQFNTPFPIPSSSRRDPEFSAEANWRGRRHACPWNGRAWPMTNSHVIDGLIRQWRRRTNAKNSARHAAGELAGDWLQRFVRMMFHDGDVERPNCFEHYNPFTGVACEYRGIDDYQHSWVIDLIVRGVMGLHVPATEAQTARVEIDPLPMALDSARLEGVRVRGVEMSLSRCGSGYTVFIDGQSRRGTIGKPLVLAVPPLQAKTVNGVAERVGRRGVGRARVAD